MSELLLDAAGRRRSPAALPEFQARGPRATRGCATPRTPPHDRGDRDRDALRGRQCPRPAAARVDRRALARAGLRIWEALALAEADLNPRRGSLLIRRGQGRLRREVGVDDWAWRQLVPWLHLAPADGWSASSRALNSRGA
jgi:integrase